MVEAILYGFSVAFTWQNLMFCLCGVALGTFIGVLPGVGSIAAIAMLLPVSFHLEPTSALILLAGVYYGAEYGGSIASILLNLPGTPSSAVACLDGHPMARSGRAGVALFITAIASFVGGTLAIVVLMLFTPLMVKATLYFSAAEYFSAMTFALICVATIARGSALNGGAMIAVGLMLSTIGVDTISGTVRYDFGFSHLYDGINIVVIALGIFGVSEVIYSVLASKHVRPQSRVTLRSMTPTREDMTRSVLPMMRGTGIGCIVGPLPGVGPATASFLSYATEKRVSRTPQLFGTGQIEGLAGPEASNNAAVQTAFIPTLAMGIPGTATTAIMLGALMIHGITPGPRLMLDHPDIFWGVVASFWIGNILLLILNIPMIGVWVSILRIPYNLLYPLIIAIICVGVYAMSYSLFDIWLLLILGLFGYLMRLIDLEPAPLLIGFVLGPLIEENFRRALIMSYGDITVFFQRPLSATFMGLSVLLIVLIVVSALRERRHRTKLLTEAPERPQQ